MPPDPIDPQDAAPLPGTLASPCVGVCRLDRQRQDCLGCRRTLQEIGAWRDLDDPARQRVLDAAAARRDALAATAIDAVAGIGDQATDDGGME